MCGSSQSLWPVPRAAHAGDSGRLASAPQGPGLACKPGVSGDGRGLGDCRWVGSVGGALGHVLRGGDLGPPGRWPGQASAWDPVELSLFSGTSWSHAGPPL